MAPGHLVGNIFIVIKHTRSNTYINIIFNYWNKSPSTSFPNQTFISPEQILCDIEVKYCTLGVQEGLNSWCVALMRKTHEICRKSFSLGSALEDNCLESRGPIDWRQEKLRITAIILNVSPNNNNNKKILL